MNKLKQNTESAFPTAMGEGMTLRDYFAAQAMQAFIGKLVNGDETSSALIPELSYAMADVMLKAREGA